MFVLQKRNSAAIFFNCLKEVFYLNIVSTHLEYVGQALVTFATLEFSQLSLYIIGNRFVITNEGEKIPILIKNIFFLFQAFIVRQSSQTNTLALTVSIEEIIEHYLIQPSKQCGDKLSLESSEHSFDNVLSLVHHYSTTKYVKIQSVLPTLKM